MPRKNAWWEGVHSPRFQLSDQLHAFSVRTFPSFYFFVNKHLASSHFSIHGTISWHKTTLFVEREHPCTQLPFQKPQIPRTSCHAMRVMSTHSSTRPLRTLACPQVSFSVVFTKGCGQHNQWFAVVSGFHDPTNPARGFVPSYSHGIIEQLHFIDQRQAELQNELYLE